MVGLMFYASDFYGLEFFMVSSVVLAGVAVFAVQFSSFLHGVDVYLYLNVTGKKSTIYSTIPLMCKHD